MSRQTSRRDFLKTSAAASAAASLPYWFTTSLSAQDQARQSAEKSPNERFVIGCIGTGSRWDGVGPEAMNYGDVVAVCDVDRNHAEKAHKRVTEKQKKAGRDIEVAIYEDYRKIIDDPKIQVVTIVTPDHWHTKIAIEAMRAGKDVYCEKPLTLTIQESKQIRKVLEETGRVFQVGTQQRSEMDQRFLKAVALVREGRLGQIKTVQCAIGGAPSSGPIPAIEAPGHLNWDMWLGQAPLVDYRWEEIVREEGEGEKKEIKKDTRTRCHYEFRWWYEYSGGKLTDWGAHHVDIGQWAIDQCGPGQGPTVIEPVVAEHPVEFDSNGMPRDDSRYNTATAFLVKALFPNGVEMTIRHDTDNGILFEGTEGRIFVGRGSLKGKPVEDLEQNPLPEDALKKVYKGKEPQSHMGTFFQCVRDRRGAE